MKNKFSFQSHRFLLEIADGLGPTKGKVFRVGLMGNNAQPEIVELILDVLQESLEQTHNNIIQKKRKIKKV